MTRRLGLLAAVAAGAVTVDTLAPVLGASRLQTSKLASDLRRAGYLKVEERRRSGAPNFTPGALARIVSVFGLTPNGRAAVAGGARVSIRPRRSTSACSTSTAARSTPRSCSMGHKDDDRALVALLGDGKCAVCQQPLGQLFQRIRVDFGSIDPSRVRRHAGLAMFFGGGAAGHALSSVMGDVDLRDCLKFSGDLVAGSEQTICLHTGCLINEPLDLALLLERAKEIRKPAEDPEVDA